MARPTLRNLILTGLLTLVTTTATMADPTRLMLLPFDDDLQSESLALTNDEYSAAYPAGPRVTAALHDLLTTRSYQLVDSPPASLELSGTVTAAYMMSRGMPTNTVTASYRLVSLPDRTPIAEGHASGNDWNNPDAAKRLAEAIVNKAFSARP